MAETAISVYSHMTGEMECNAAKMDDALGRVTRYFYDQKKGHLPRRHISRRCFCCAGHGSEKMKQAEFRAQR